MKKFEFSVFNLKQVLLVTFIIVPLFQYLNTQYTIWWAACLVGLAAFPLYFFSHYIFRYKITFFENYFEIKQGPAKTTKLFYTQIKSFSYSYDRHKTVKLVAATENIKFPVAQLLKVEALSVWLKSKNPAIETTIINNIVKE